MGILNASTILNNGSVTSCCIFLGHVSYRVMNLGFCYSGGHFYKARALCVLCVLQV